MPTLKVLTGKVNFLSFTLFEKCWKCDSGHEK